MLIINILFLLFGSIATFAAFGGETWEKNDKPLIKKITVRGWISLFCLVGALSIGITKEVENSRTKAIAAKRNEKAQAELLANLDSTNSELVETKNRLKITEERLLSAVEEATHRIPKEIDHPFYQTGMTHNNVVNSYQTQEPLLLMAGEILDFAIHGEGERRPDLISFIIGTRRYLLHSPSGNIRVIGFEGELMPVLVDFPRGLTFAIKMTVLSTIRKSMK